MCKFSFNCTTFRYWKYIKVNLGSNQGINLGNLALSESRDTPFSVFEVIDVGPNQSSLMPLNLSRNIKNYYGKTITFMEF